MKKTLMAGILAAGTLFSPMTGAYADTTTDIIQDAKQYMGTPYVWGGETPRGFDCSGFLNYVYEKNGVDLPRTVAEIYKLGTPVAKSELIVGDMVFFETYKPGASHAGIYLGGGMFIHTSSTMGVSINSMNTNPYWNPRYIGAKRILKQATPAVKTPAPPVVETTFTDVGPNYWAYDAIEEFSERKLVNGFKGGTFQPAGYITREQAAVVLTAFLELEKSGDSSPFSDIAANRWSADAIAATYEHDIFRGDGNGQFNPEDELSRAELAAVLSRMYQLQDETTQSAFVDVPDSQWAYSDIQATYQAGIFGGYQDGSFRPYRNTTRAEFVTVLDRTEDQLSN